MGPRTSPRCCPLSPLRRRPVLLRQLRSRRLFLRSLHLPRHLSLLSRPPRLLILLRRQRLHLPMLAATGIASSKQEPRLSPAIFRKGHTAGWQPSPHLPFLKDAN